MDLAALSQILQAAISPMALISGIGLLLLSMTNRFARTTDRTRLLAAERRGAAPEHQRHLDLQIGILFRRSRLLQLSISFAAVSLLLVALLVIALFAVAAFAAPLQALVLGLFIASQLALALSLVLFIRDLALALVALRHDLGMSS